MIGKPEIMSPAGYWPQLRAAIEAGADAVYFGLTQFSARAKVGFTLDELPEVMRTLHGRGVRGYLAFNTLIFEEELSDAARTIAATMEAGVDAWIVQDAGVARLARQMMPRAELHASTQMSITDAAGVRFAQNLGLDRVTLARELSLREVTAIRRETNCNLEIFVHGALCVAYSGQCFSSEAWGGRSANRGQCAQACRLPYELLVDGVLKPLGDARYLLSPGDLYTLAHVPEIVNTGVSALKIEGRYKDPDYVALTTRAYRQAVDAALAGCMPEIDAKEELQLEQVYSRGRGAFFVTGTNHQAVVEGRAPRHRGVRIGRVVRVRTDSVLIAPSEANDLAPLKAGDGVVFDAADWRSPQEPEEGGRVFQAIPVRGQVELRFGNGAVNFERIREGDLVWRTHDPALDRVARPFMEATFPVARQPVNARVMAHSGELLTIEWMLARCPEVQVTVTSPETLAVAARRGATVETVRAQLERLGNTPYALASLDVDLSGSPFIPASLLNQLRRGAVDELQRIQTSTPRWEVRDAAEILTSALTTKLSTADSGAAQLHLLVRQPEQLEAALELSPASITLDYLDLYGLRPSVGKIKATGIEARVASPRVLKPGEERILNFLLSLDCAVLVRSAGMLHILGGRAYPALIADFSLNTANSLTSQLYLEMGAQRVTPTHDLNAGQIVSLAERCGGDRVEVIAFQHLPVFHTEHCVFCRFLSTGTSYLDCGRPCEKHRIEVRDERGRAHPVMADVGCRNTVFGSEAQEASRHLDAWKRAGIRHFRLEFAHETAEEVRRVTTAFADTLGGCLSSAQLRSNLQKYAPRGITEGSLFVPALTILQ